MAASASHRYREPRVSSDQLAEALTCTFGLDGSASGPHAVVNVSSAGLLLAIDGDPGPLEDGALYDLTLWCGERLVFRADAKIAHRSLGARSTLGVRFAQHRLDVPGLRSRSALGARCRGELALWQRQTDRLPQAWRAAVADVRQLLDTVARMLDADSQPAATPEGDAGENALIAEIFEAWGPRYQAQLAALHGLSKDLASDDRELAREYAHQLLWPALSSCPMHSRAHQKPLGYAGDYQMMLYYFAEQYVGPTRYARFLHYTSQRYTLGRAVVARQQCMRSAVASALRPEGRTRVLCLASGPALELEEMLASGALAQQVDLILMDQDESALAYANGNLRRLIDARSLDITLTCLHFSVRQLLAPKTEAERAIVAGLIGWVDLVYNAGLYDYLPEPIAQRLTAVLYGQLRPGGRLYLGNLRETPDTTWVMEYVLAWHLIYRTPESMLALAPSLTPTPTEISVEADATGQALFLSVRAPG